MLLNIYRKHANACTSFTSFLLLQRVDWVHACICVCGKAVCLINRAFGKSKLSGSLIRGSLWRSGSATFQVCLDNDWRLDNCRRCVRTHSHTQSTVMIILLDYVQRLSACVRLFMDEVVRQLWSLKLYSTLVWVASIGLHEMLFPNTCCFVSQDNCQQCSLAWLQKHSV